MTPGRSLAGFDPACSPFSVENFLLYSSANSAILSIEGSAVAEDRFTETLATYLPGLLIPASSAICPGICRFLCELATAASTAAKRLHALTCLHPYGIVEINRRCRSVTTCLQIRICDRIGTFFDLPLSIFQSWIAAERRIHAFAYHKTEIIRFFVHIARRIDRTLCLAAPANNLDFFKITCNNRLGSLECASFSGGLERTSELLFLPCFAVSVHRSHRNLINNP